MADQLQYGRSAITVLNIGAVGDKANRQTERVGQNVALAAVDLLAGIEATDAAALGRLDALAVDHARSGARLAAFQITGSDDKVMVDPAQDTAVAPVVKVALHG